MRIRLAMVAEMDSTIPDIRRPLARAVAIDHKRHDGGDHDKRDDDVPRHVRTLYFFGCVGLAGALPVSDCRLALACPSRPAQAALCSISTMRMNASTI